MGWRKLIHYSLRAAFPERLIACRDELRSLLGEERLAGASLLVLANKQDLPSAAKVSDIAKVSRLINCICELTLDIRVSGKFLRISDRFIHDIIS